MTILVTGANGQLGSEMRIVSKDSADRYIFTDVCDASQDSIDMLHKLAGEDVDISTTRLDITDIDAIRKIVSENDVKAVINCAAYTNVEVAEDNYDLAELLNATAPENLAVAMKEVDGLLVHISTDYVFGKEPYNTPCKEDQKGTPTGVYGLTKLHGEQKIIASGVKHIIIRTAWLYSEFGKNFVKTILNLIKTKPSIKVVYDQVGTPTYALDLANAIITIIDQICHSERNEEPKYGVYHFSNEGVCSWYDFAKMIAEYSRFNKCSIEPCLSDDFPSKVARPAYSVLNKTKIKDTFDLRILFWIDSFMKCLYHL